MKLVGIFYMNLARRTDRNTYMRAMLTGIGVPLEAIHRIDAHDNRDYADTHALCDAAMADGFQWFDSLRECWMDKGDIAVSWTFNHALTLIEAALGPGECVMLMTDDQTLRQPFWKFEAAIGDLYDLKILQVSQWLPHEKEWFPTKTWSPRNYTKSNAHVYHGFNGAGDGVTIYTREGATLMKSWYTADPYQFAEIQIYNHSATALPGCYSFVEPHLWSGCVDDRVLSVGGTDRVLS